MAAAAVAAAAVAAAAVAAAAVASLKVYLTTLLCKVFRFSNFFGGRGQGRGRDGTGRDRQTYGQTDFSPKILF